MKTFIKLRKPIWSAALLTLAMTVVYAGTENADYTHYGVDAGGTSTNKRNSFFGVKAGINNNGGADNTFIGDLAGRDNTTGDRNTYVGAAAGALGSMGTSNSFFGYAAGISNIANNNTFLGAESGKVTTSGSENTFVGLWAGLSNVTGSDNTFLGAYAGQKNTASANTFVGFQAGYNNTSGDLNNFFGWVAGYSNTTGSDNSFFGTEAGLLNTEGSSNSFFGTEAGLANTTGFDNSMFGSGAGVSNVTGNFNSFFGKRSGQNNTTGLSNSFFGHGAGSINTTGSNNSAFGRFANLSDGLTNATAIGNQAKVEQSNAMVLGSIPGVNDCGGTCPTEFVDVGIGVSTPQAPLHIQRTTSSGPQEMFRFTNTGGSYITWEKTTGNQKWFFTHENAAAGRLIMDHQDNGGLDGPEFALDTDGNIVVPGQVTASNFNTVSDRNAKQGIEELEGTMVLAKLEEIPVSQWRYKSAPETRHIGPMAQDFHAAFGLGNDDRHISPTDMAGVALAAIKAQQEKIKALEKANHEKDAELDIQRQEIAALKAVVEQAVQNIDGLKVRLQMMEGQHALTQAALK